MISNNIRKLMIEIPDRLREVILTKAEVKAFKTISHYSRANPFRACEIWEDKSAQHKSNILWVLWKKGYIDRRQVIAPSGGYEFEYWPIDALTQTNSEDE